MDNKLLELAEKRHNFEIQRLKDLDSKAGNLIGYVGIITSLILGVGTFGLLGKQSRPDYFSSTLVGLLPRDNPNKRFR